MFFNDTVITSFSFSHPSFNEYIKDHHDQIKEVFDYKHIAFLTLWLSDFIFCSNYLKVAKTFIHLATQLYEWENVCLSRLIMGSLYDSLGLASPKLNYFSNFDENLMILGSIWILQICINAIFEIFLKHCYYIWLS